MFLEYQRRLPPRPPHVSRRLATAVVGLGGAGSFSGTLLVQRFAVQDGALVAIGLVTGALTTSTGLMSMARTVRMPATVLAATRDGVQLDLGSVSLDILWWRIDLGRVVVDADGAPAERWPIEGLIADAAVPPTEPSRMASLLNSFLDLKH
jgi:hypothetical protein